MDEFKGGDRVRVSDCCPLSAIRGEVGIVIAENHMGKHGPMIEVKVKLPDLKQPLRFYPWEIVKL